MSDFGQDTITALAGSTSEFAESVGRASIHFKN